MAPRKRMRLMQPDPSALESTADTTGRPVQDNLLNDPWTDEEEIGLFKALIRSKPTGIHKHFRMLQLREYLLENHYIHPRSEHTKIPGIWHKLASLYDLEALDQREDSRQLSDISDEDSKTGSGSEEPEQDDAYSLAANRIHRESFELPQDDYGQRQWQHRIPAEPDQQESPLLMPELNLLEEVPVHFTPTVSTLTEDAHRVPRRRGRPSKSSALEESAPAPVPKRRARRGASLEEDEVRSVVEAADKEEDDEEQDEDDGEAEDGVDDSEEADATTRARPARTRTRAASRGRRKGRRR